MRSPNKWLEPRRVTEEEAEKDNNCSTCHFISACETKGDLNIWLSRKICDDYTKCKYNKGE